MTLSILDIKEMYARDEKIACITAYDSSFSGLVDRAGVDAILVGDSLGMVVQGKDTTLTVSMRDVIYHAQCVNQTRERAYLIADLPFMAYATKEQALGNSARLVSEAGVDMVKLEGGEIIAETICAITEFGIPVCAHLGLTPQSIKKLGKYKVQAREEDKAEQLKKDALALQDAGAEILVMECVPADLATEVTTLLDIPTIGIGGSVECSGQVLVLHDMLGVSPRTARFNKNFLEGNESIEAAVKDYVISVKEKRFPESKHQY